VLSESGWQMEGPTPSLERLILDLPDKEPTSKGTEGRSRFSFGAIRGGDCTVRFRVSEFASPC
jgi:hypothetical protein